MYLPCLTDTSQVLTSSISSLDIYSLSHHQGPHRLLWKGDCNDSDAVLGHTHLKSRNPIK